MLFFYSLMAFLPTTVILLLVFHLWLRRAARRELVAAQHPKNKELHV
jgi:hypothetical protein